MKTPRWLIPVVYGLLAVLAYGPLLRSFFLADDFLFLDDVLNRGSWMWPHDLPGQLVRPVVMLAFRVDHALWGLSPLGYHLTNLVAHVASALLLFAITRRLTGRVRTAFWTGLLFVVFAGHAEAVGWISGRADVIGTALGLTSLWLYGLSIDRREHGAIFAWAAYAAFAAALLAKESMIVIPALAAGIDLCSTRAQRWPQRARSMVWRMVGFAGIIVGYLALRASVVGTVAGTYAGYRPALAVQNLRVFAFRALLPVTGFGVPNFSNRGDLVAYAAVTVAVLRMAWLKRSPVALYPGLALLITLLPVLPLGISMDEPQGERLVYLPSAFGSMLIMTLLGGVTSRAGELMGRVVSVFLCSVNLIALFGASRTFAEAGVLSEQVITSVGTTVAGTPANTRVFVLNAPDTYRGIYVFRNGFLHALRLFQPEVFSDGRFVHGIAINSVSSLTDLASVRVVGPLAFSVDLGTGRIPYPLDGSTAFYTVSDQKSGGFEIAFSGSVRHGLVLYTSRGRVNRSSVINADGAPFGVIDLPGGDVSCDQGYVRFAGWALNGEHVSRVEIAREEPPGSGGTTPGLVVLGEARFQQDARPDVAAAYPDYPDRNRAGWDFQLPCSALPPGNSSTIHVIAAGGGGARTDLGRRAVRRTSGEVR